MFKKIIIYIFYSKQLKIGFTGTFLKSIFASAVRSIKVCNRSTAAVDLTWFAAWEMGVLYKIWTSLSCSGDSKSRRRRMVTKSSKILHMLSYLYKKILKCSLKKYYVSHLSNFLPFLSFIRFFKSLFSNIWTDLTNPNKVLWVHNCYICVCSIVRCWTISPSDCIRVLKDEKDLGGKLDYLYCQDLKPWNSVTPFVKLYITE